MRPLVLVSSDRREGGGHHPGPRVRPIRPELFVTEDYLEAIAIAGGIPVVVPSRSLDVNELLVRVDAVVLTGGAFDIHPSWYGAQVHGRLDRTDAARTSLELELTRAALARDLPILGICGGMQAMAVASGGTLIQDISDLERSPTVEHEQPTDPSTPWHPVRLSEPLTSWMNPREEVNSTHHQAVNTPGAHFEACGWADDGVIEAIHSPGRRFAFGLQWHPERLGDLRPYRALIASCTAPS